MQDKHFDLLITKIDNKISIWRKKEKEKSILLASFLPNCMLKMQNIGKLSKSLKTLK